LAGNLALKYGKLLVIADAALIKTMHISFDGMKASKTEGSLSNAKKLPSNVEQLHCN